MKLSIKFISLSIVMSLNFATYSYAAEVDEISEALFEESTEILDIEVVDQTLVQTLLVDLEYSVEEGLIDVNLIQEIEEGIENERELDIDELIDQNIIEQEESWIEKSPELLDAFELVKSEFHQCRIASSGGVSGCARGLGIKLQVASVQLALDELEEQRGTLEGLEGTELEEALAEVSTKELQLNAKLSKAEKKLLRLGNNSEEYDDLRKIVTDVRALTKSADIQSGNIPVNEENDNENKNNQENDNENKNNQENGSQNKNNQGNGNKGGRGKS